MDVDTEVVIHKDVPHEPTSDIHFEVMVAVIHGFYYEGMPLDDLAHRLRTNADAFCGVLRPFTRAGKWFR